LVFVLVFMFVCSCHCPCSPFYLLFFFRSTYEMAILVLCVVVSCIHRVCSVHPNCSAISVAADVESSRLEQNRCAAAWCSEMTPPTRPTAAQDEHGSSMLQIANRARSAPQTTRLVEMAEGEFGDEDGTRLRRYVSDVQQEWNELNDEQEKWHQLLVAQRGAQLPVAKGVEAAISSPEIDPEIDPRDPVSFVQEISDLGGEDSQVAALDNSGVFGATPLPETRGQDAASVQPAISTPSLPDEAAFVARQPRQSAGMATLLRSDSLSQAQSAATQIQDQQAFDQAGSIAQGYSDFQHSTLAMQQHRLALTFPPATIRSEVQNCAPQCTWQCETTKCDEVCEPVCQPPRCETRCQGSDFSGCTVDCDQPHCSVVCKRNSCRGPHGCPSCQSNCGEPVCRLRCPQAQPCRNVCEQPSCEWRCRAPEECPAPMCHMVCEDPKNCLEAAAPTTYGATLPPLLPGEAAVRSFAAPAGPRTASASVSVMHQLDGEQATQLRTLTLPMTSQL